MTKNKTHKVIGIDLGTTMSCMAGVLNGELTIIENRDGERVTPSVVCFPKDGGMPIVGNNAITAGKDNPLNFVYEVKRMFGKKMNDENIQKAISYWPFEVRMIPKGTDASDNLGIVIKENGKEKIYEPIQVSACVLSYLLDSAKQRLGVYPDFAVITVPAYFSDLAKRRTLDAAAIAFGSKKTVDENGKEVKLNCETVLLAEPTAAAMAYGSKKIKDSAFMQAVQNTDTPGQERVLVFDLGGGTFDVCVLDFTFDPAAPMGEVKGTDGDSFLGGADFDNVIIKIARQEFKKKYNYDPFETITDVEEKKKLELRVRREAIKVKTSLSTNTNVTFHLSCFHNSNDLIFDLSSTMFYRSCTDLFRRIIERCRGVLLTSAGYEAVYDDSGKLKVDEILAKHPGLDIEGIIRTAKNAIKKVIMVGGSSRIPKVMTTIAEFFGELLDGSTNPVLKQLVDAFEMTMNKDEIEKARKVNKITFPLNPDEAIAYGAGFYANTRSPEEGVNLGQDILLVDSVPLNLCIETYGGVATKLIAANTPIPCKKVEKFSTAENNQTSVQIRVFQGNRAMAENNSLLGEFTLSGIPPAPRGVPQILVTFEVDQNNILTVTAKEESSGISQQISIENLSNRLTKEKIREMIEQAEQFSKQDEEKAALANAKSLFENTLYTMEDKLSKATVPESNKTNIQQIINNELSWLRSQECSTSTAASIQERMQKVIAEIQQLMGGATTGAGPASGAAPGGNAGNDNVDVEEVN